ncbi:MFS transporter, partial [Salmonella enterica subsp. enterica serovar Typhi]|nr:MFS transporter [Salmonella enterica subsp. enterica serovar Typhi]
ILGNPATVLWMSIVSGYILESLGWRWMFILEGLPAVIWAFLWWKLVNDHPKDAKWLNEDEKAAINHALSEEQKELKPVKDYREAFKSKTVILLSLQYALWSIGVYGFVMWLPTIINSAPNASIVTTGWLASIPYVLACVL